MLNRYKLDEIKELLIQRLQRRSKKVIEHEFPDVTCMIKHIPNSMSFSLLMIDSDNVVKMLDVKITQMKDIDEYVGTIDIHKLLDMHKMNPFSKPYKMGE